MKELREFTTDARADVIHLTMLTQLAVYKDIIPGYRIRKMSEKEAQAQTLSKEVRKLRNYEETLLSNYQAYLQSLEDLAQANTVSGNRNLLKVAVFCLTELLGSASHFNFRVNILTAIISKMIMKKNPDITKMCCDAIEKLFINDEIGEHSLEAMKIISDMFKAAKNDVLAITLDPFLSLNLKDCNSKRIQSSKASMYDNPKKRKKETVHVSKKMKKINEYRKEVDQELKEAESSFDLEEKQRFVSLI